MGRGCEADRKIDEVDMDLSERIRIIRDKTGCGIGDCKRAFEYAESKGIPYNDDLAIAYLQAKGFAVSTPEMTFDERVMSFFREIIKEKIS